MFLQSQQSNVSYHANPRLKPQSSEGFPREPSDHSRELGFTAEQIFQTRAVEKALISSLAQTSKEVHQFPATLELQMAPYDRLVVTRGLRAGEGPCCHDSPVCRSAADQDKSLPARSSHPGCRPEVMPGTQSFQVGVNMETGWAQLYYSCRILSDTLFVAAARPKPAIIPSPNLVSLNGY